LLTDEAGQPIGIATIVKDISELKRTEQELRQSEANFRKLIEEVPLAISIVQDGRRVFVNEGTAKMTGYSRDELMHMTPGQLLDPDQAELYKRIKDNCSEQDVTSHHEFKGTRKDGRDLWVEYSVTQIEFNGRPAFFGASIDVTVRKQLELELEERVEQRTAQLRESASRLRIITDQAPAVLWSKDNELTITSCSGAALGHIGLELEQIVGLQTEAPDSTIIKAHSLALQGIPNADGVEHEGRSFECRVEPVSDQSEHITGCVGIAWDITERIRAEEQFKQHQEELARIGRVHLAGQMVSGLAHELNQPLGAISLHAGALKMLVESAAHVESELILARPLAATKLMASFLVGSCFARTLSASRRQENQRYGLNKYSAVLCASANSAFNFDVNHLNAESAETQRTAEKNKCAHCARILIVCVHRNPIAVICV